MSTPSSIIKLYEEYELTPDYTDTRWFANDNARDTYFDSIVATDGSGHPYVVNPSQHTRVDNGKVKVPWNISEIHGYTYMSIQNQDGTTGRQDHRYYCFVTDMEYVSDMCTEISFQIDVIQTYIHQISYWKAFVERCHGDTDEIGDNIITEPFNPSEFFVNDEAYDEVYNVLSLVIGVSTDEEDVTLNGITYSMRPRVYSGVYTCVRYFYVALSDVNGQFMQDLLDHFAGEKRKEIVEMYVCPRLAIPDPNTGEEAHNVGTGQPTRWTTGVKMWAKGNPINANCYNKVSGYTPKNKKLYTAPFTFLRVNNGDGQTKDYAFEYWEDIEQDFPKFIYEGSFIGEPSLTLYPYDYKRKTAIRIDNSSSDGVHDLTQHYSYEQGLSMEGFPSSAFNIDAYAQYQSQNGVSNIFKGLGASLVGALVGFVATGGVGALLGGGASVLLGSTAGATGTALATTGAPIAGHVLAPALGLGAGASQGIHYAQLSRGLVGAATGGTIGTLRNGVNVVAEQIKAKNTADSTYGSVSGKNTAIQNNHKYFVFQRMCCEPQYAEQVDNYFTMYGYAQNKIMNVRTYLTNMDSGHLIRPYWKFIKCIDFTVHGAIENKYKDKISNIFNNGIRFWYNTAVPIGNYSLDNSPTTP